MLATPKPNRLYAYNQLLTMLLNLELEFNRADDSQLFSQLSSNCLNVRFFQFTTGIILGGSQLWNTFIFSSFLIMWSEFFCSQSFLHIKSDNLQNNMIGQLFDHSVINSKNPTILNVIQQDNGTILLAFQCLMVQLLFTVKG